MAGKYLTVIGGSVLLIGCLLGIAILIFGPITEDSLPRDSYKTHYRDHSSLDDWKSKHANSPGISLKKSYTQNDTAESTDKFQILFSKSNNKSHGGVSQLNKFIPPNLVLSNKRFNNATISKLSVQTTPKAASHEFGSAQLPTEEDHYLNPVNHGHFGRKPLSSPGEVLLESTEAVPDAAHNSNMEATTGEKTQNDSQDDDTLHSNVEPEVSAEVQEQEDEDIEETLPDDHYIGEEIQNEEEAGDGGASIDFTSMLDQISSLYSNGLPNLHRLFQFLNETVNRENTSGLLTQLNNLYSRPEILSSTLGSDLFSGRNTYESSLTAFVFMSFGIFLLNQIHSLIGSESLGGRQFDANSLLETSKLQILFEPPLRNLSFESEGSFEEDNNTISMMRMANYEVNSTSSSGNSTLVSSNYVNNMFRAMLNLVNAYSTNPQVLECIWSSYCEDLDKTSANDGLYGIAARINSIGLRLIMHQISSELTLDVLLRSLLGWDGLPCSRMFPVCPASEAVLTLQAATSGFSNHFDQATTIPSQ